ncbi:MAG: TonB-dependent receptor plug domain-containing protein, partial [Candidatus Aminicenantes bacterium]|nr:TonB-dependent receptor plug domain-containing protein [Candidatus Aminicenantes bacterium]
LEEEVTVIAESPVIDVKMSGLSSNFTSQDIENLPAGRHSFADIVKQVPGMLAQGESGALRWSFAGSGVEGNAFYFDGVDQSSPELGIPWTNPNQDIMEEVQVSGIGTAAEYGLITGAVINVITKSGGNKLSGSLSHYGRYGFTTGDNNPDPYNEATELGSQSFKRWYKYDLSLSLGGPIMKDKLWFFGNFNIRRGKESDWQDDPEYAAKDIQDEGFFKLTANISNSHKLVASFAYENEDFDEIPDPWNKPETVIKEVLQTYIWNVRYTWLTGSNSYFDIKYSGWWSPDHYDVPVAGADLDKRPHVDDATGVLSNAPGWSGKWDILTHQVNAGFSHFAEDFLGADHDFKVGVQYNRGSLKAMGGYPGGGYYIDYYGDPYLLYVQQQYSYGGIVDKIGTFLDDSISIGDRLTINIGLRFDHQKATYPALPLLDGWEETSENAQGIDDLITWNVFSPRIGIAFQLTPDGKTLLKAHYGRYYDSMHISNFSYPGPGYTDWYAYEWWGGAWELFDSFPGEIGYIMDPDIKNPYSEQLFIGLERELIPDFSVGAMYIRKTEGNSLGWEGRNTAYEQVQRVSSDNDQTYTVFNRTGPYPEQWQTNPEGYGQKYNGLILTFDKKYSKNWMMNASITWSRSTGLNMRSHSTSQHNLTSYAGDFGVDPNDLINAEGDLQHDKRWVIKFTGGYNFPLDIFLGAYFTYQTGRPRPAQVRVNLDQGRREILAEPRGDERYPSFYTLNLRAQKTFTLKGSWKLKVMLDVFNATNDATFRSWRSNSMWRDTFTEKSGLPDPISLQLGFKLEF